MTDWKYKLLDVYANKKRVTACIIHGNVSILYSNHTTKKHVTTHSYILTLWKCTCTMRTKSNFYHPLYTHTQLLWSSKPATSGEEVPTYCWQRFKVVSISQYIGHIYFSTNYLIFFFYFMMLIYFSLYSSVDGVNSHISWLGVNIRT
jgi:hypothetical protein